MNSDKIEKIQNETAFPDSLSVMRALHTVWEETKKENQWKVQGLERRIRDLQIDNRKLQNTVEGRDINGELIPGKLLQEP